MVPGGFGAMFVSMGHLLADEGVCAQPRIYQMTSVSSLLGIPVNRVVPAEIPWLDGATHKNSGVELAAQACAQIFKDKQKDGRWWTARLPGNSFSTPMERYIASIERYRVEDLWKDLNKTVSSFLTLLKQTAQMLGPAVAAAAFLSEVTNPLLLAASAVSLVLNLDDVAVDVAECYYGVNDARQTAKLINDHPAGFIAHSLQLASDGLTLTETLEFQTSEDNKNGTLIWKAEYVSESKVRVRMWPFGQRIGSRLNDSSPLVPQYLRIGVERPMSAFRLEP